MKANIPFPSQTRLVWSIGMPSGYASVPGATVANWTAKRSACFSVTCALATRFSTLEHTKGGYAYNAYWMCRAIKRDGKAICFEPQSCLADSLRQMAKILHFDQMTVENLGLSSVSGERTLNVPAGSTSPVATLEAGLSRVKGHAYSANVVSLDEYYRNHPAGDLTLIKCDVEGHELDVFHGGERLLRTYRPALLSECDERHHSRYTSRDVFDYLKRLGFRRFFFTSQNTRLLNEFCADLHGNPVSKHNVNNFLFCA